MQEKELLQLIRKARSKDPDAFSCKFCPNGTPILKLAVHPF